VRGGPISGIGEYSGEATLVVQDTRDVQSVALGQLAKEIGQHDFSDVMELNLGGHEVILPRPAYRRYLSSA
jgi:hypothetical protein